MIIISSRARTCREVLARVRRLYPSQLRMSQLLVETLHAVQWLAGNSSSPASTRAAGTAVHGVGLVLGMVILLSCAVLVEFRDWLRRKRELTGVQTPETPECPQ
jgi:hypothetical protein